MLKGDGHVDVAYIFSEDAARAFDLLPSNKGRSSMVHALIKAIGLVDYMNVYAPEKECLSRLECFHSKDYLNALLSSPGALTLKELEEFGLVDDAALFPGLESYLKYLCGTIDAIGRALDDGFRYVINWDGGRHHAQSSSASGYCYINDIVVLILESQLYYDRILYVDLDLHHGDGVENAFFYSDRVFTLSLHKFKPGFFPGTGDSESRGLGKGTGYCLNVPIEYEIKGEEYVSLFKNCFSEVVATFDPDLIVCVCGADSLATDPHQGFNLGSIAYNRCIEAILQTQIPAIFLGGGGYNHADTAKCWARLTHSIISSNTIQFSVPPFPLLVPEHEFWPQYVNNDEMEVKEHMRPALKPNVYYDEWE